jgi:hypothetical protein
MKKILFVVFGVGVFIFFIFSIFLQLRGEESNAPEFISPDGLAVMENDEAVASELTSAEYRQLREDAKFFAVNYIDTYKRLDKEIVFRFNSFSKEENVFTFDGQYKDDKRKVIIKSTKAKNERLFSVFSVDNETYFETLPSQSRRNKYISTLPVQEQTSYLIEYDIAREVFVLKLFRIETGESALASIEGSTGIPSSQEDVDILPLGDDNLDRFSPKDVPLRTGAEVVSE